MKGLLIKELIHLRLYGRVIACMVLFFLFFGVFQGTLEGIASILAMLSIMLTVMLGLNSMSFDASCKWDCFALSLPLSRRQLVAAKYLFVLIMAAALFLLDGILCGILVPFGLRFSEALLVFCGCFAAGICLIAVFFPLLYRFGIERARLFYLLLVLLPVGGRLLAGKLGLSLPEVDWSAVILLSLPAALALLGISYLISAWIFQRKEL